MFRHKEKNTSVETKAEGVEKIAEVASVEKSNSVTTKTENEVIKELLEKNLKWSQIIYEQNRKIHSKMMWTAVAGWFRLILILAPLIWAIWYLPGIIKNLQNNYGSLLGGKSSDSQSQSNSMEQLLKILPLDAAKQEQLKALLK
ncbi:MAG: hypothetical protein HY979_02395 [Candidatus Magasanikbacteria bacterium]|nr:hypothetical protein [Candidatus Magasanikbacteria bacterium]